MKKPAQQKPKAKPALARKPQRRRPAEEAAPPPREVIEEGLIWNGTRIAVTYEPDWLRSSRGHPEYATSHLAIQSVEPENEPLPITETGYRSHFLPPGIVEEQGGPAAYVRAWLDAEAQTSAWRKSWERRRQLLLF